MSYIRVEGFLFQTIILQSTKQLTQPTEPHAGMIISSSAPVNATTEHHPARGGEGSRTKVRRSEKSRHAEVVLCWEQRGFCLGIGNGFFLVSCCLDAAPSAAAIAVVVVVINGAHCLLRCCCWFGWLLDVVVARYLPSLKATSPSPRHRHLATVGGA